PDGSIKRVVTTNKGVGALKDASNKINLAFNCKVTSSSALDSVVTAAKNAVDENNSTPWIGGNYLQEWIMLDLGAVKSFNEIQLFPEFPIKAYQYKIEISDDNKTWRLADDQWENKKIGSPMVTQSKFDTRYIRITMRNEKDNPRPGIWEVKVY
ncbi:MAG: discoidin domain-containing protein, partial [Ginsengibacter sp.]